MDKKKRLLDQYGKPMKSDKKDESQSSIKSKIQKRITFLLTVVAALALFFTNLESISSYLYVLCRPIEIVEIKMQDSSMDLTIMNNKSKPVLIKRAIFTGKNYPVESMTLAYKQQLLPSDTYNFYLPLDVGEFEEPLELMYNLKSKSHSRFKIHFVDSGDVNMFSEINIKLESTLFRDIRIRNLLVYRGLRIENGVCHSDPLNLIDEVKPNAKKNNISTMIMLSEKPLIMEDKTRKMIESNIVEGGELE